VSPGGDLGRTTTDSTGTSRTTRITGPVTYCTGELLVKPDGHA
jgi:hypothetical protein